ncbi:cupin domain-containing protein [Streptomyces sp. NPDC101225]|uniref:cupin domain-containing protein n=1 Tax=Streptomyces sp. NPDC101225 TaxID=3366135 RepID=UPI0038246DB4
MSDGTMLAPGAGTLIVGGGLHTTLKIAGGSKAITSTFETIVPPGFDVGAHYHTHGEELFYVVSGNIELFAFEPAIRSKTHWSTWVSKDGRSPLHAGPGSLMHVPAGCPHAFRNTTDEPTVMLFQAAPSGHEDYFEELAELLLGSRGQLDPDELTKLRLRHDVHQLTAMASPT